MMNELSPSANTINDKPLSLILSLRINNQFQTIDQQRYQNNQESISEQFSNNFLQLIFKNNSTTIDDTSANAMVLDEDHEQSSVKSTDGNTLSLVETSSINPLISSNETTEISSVISSTLKDDHISQWINSQISDEATPEPDLTTNEIIMLQKLSEAINKIIQNEINSKEDSIPISAKQLEISERRKQRYKRQREIINIAKKALKSAYKKRHITKKQYKKIMKKIVTKAIHSNKINQKWIGKMIDAYVEKYRSIKICI